MWAGRPPIGEGRAGPANILFHTLASRLWNVAAWSEFDTEFCRIVLRFFSFLLPIHFSSLSFKPTLVSSHRNLNGPSLTLSIMSESEHRGSSPDKRPSFEMTWGSSTSSGYHSQDESDSELEQYFTARTSLFPKPRRAPVSDGGKQVRHSWKQGQWFEFGRDVTIIIHLLWQFVAVSWWCRGFFFLNCETLVVETLFCNLTWLIGPISRSEPQNNWVENHKWRFLC